MIFDFDKDNLIHNELYLLINKYKTNTGHYHTYRTYKIENEETGEIGKCTLEITEELDLFFKRMSLLAAVVTILSTDKKYITMSIAYYDIDRLWLLVDNLPLAIDEM